MRSVVIIIFLVIPCSLLAQWITLNSGTVENLKGVFFINSETGYVSGEYGKMYKTVNGGIDWDTLNTGIITDINSIYFFNESSGIACANDGIIIATTTSGTSWNTVSSGVSDHLNTICFSGTRGVCSGDGGTLLYSTNSGSSWTIAENGFLVTYYGADMFSESIAYASGVNTIFQPFVAKSTNGGVNWTFSSFYLNGNEGNLSGIKFISENTGFVTSRVFDGQGGISKTTNGGVNWTTQLFPQWLHSLDFTGINTGYCVGQNGMILRTTDSGMTWENQSGTSGTLRCVFFTDSITGYAAGDLGTIIKTTNGGLSAVGDENEFMPVDLTLYQNYPNPFNPVTTIKYSIPAEEVVSLKIYNSLGVEILELVNGNHLPGEYNVTFDGSNFASGIFYYKIISGSFSEVRKMVMIK